MTPDFQILANSKDITAKLRDRLLSLCIIDEAGTRADRLALQFDDRDSAIAWPEQGAEIEVSLGDKYRGITYMGLYVVDEIAHVSPPATMTIRAKATNMSAAIKAPASKSWHETTVGNLVKNIAAQHQLTAKISNTLANIAIPHLDQTEESNLHLLTRLVRTYGAIAKPMGQSLVFVQRGEAKTATQKHLPIITINPRDIIQHHLLQTERNRYQAVRAYWHDVITAEAEAVFVGQDKPVYVLRHPYATKDEARCAAKAKLAALQRVTSTLSLTLLGNPHMQAEGKVAVLGLRKPIAGEWLIEQAKHQLNNQGFVTHIKTTLFNSQHKE